MARRQTICGLYLSATQQAVWAELEETRDVYSTARALKAEFLNVKLTGKIDRNEQKLHAQMCLEENVVTNALSFALVLASSQLDDSEYPRAQLESDLSYAFDTCSDSFVNTDYRSGAGVLAYAIALQNVNATAFFLNRLRSLKGTDPELVADIVNMADCGNSTPLCEAVEHPALNEIVLELLELGADPRLGSTHYHPITALMTRGVKNMDLSVLPLIQAMIAAVPADGTQWLLSNCLGTYRNLSFMTYALSIKTPEYSLEGNPILELIIRLLVSENPATATSRLGTKGFIPLFVAAKNRRLKLFLRAIAPLQVDLDFSSDRETTGIPTTTLAHVVAQYGILTDAKCVPRKEWSVRDAMQKLPVHYIIDRVFVTIDGYTNVPPHNALDIFKYATSTLGFNTGSILTYMFSTAFPEYGSVHPKHKCDLVNILLRNPGQGISVQLVNEIASSLTQNDPIRILLKNYAYAWSLPLTHLNIDEFPPIIAVRVTTVLLCFNRLRSQLEQHGALPALPPELVYTILTSAPLF